MSITCPKCHSGNPETIKFCGECGAQLSSLKEIHPEVTETFQTPIKELTTGSTFAGRYQIIEELGHGGMGRVYKVLDSKIGEKIALKLIRPEAVFDKNTVERFSNELKLARKIRHKNICQMFDLGEDQGTRYITMEYVHGEDLKQLIRKVGRLSPGQAIGIARQVCEGLEEAHKLGIVHRDLKPQNIMIDEDGNARIMDFGIARSLSGKSITGAGVMIGTPEYMSPEQVEGKDIDQRSDIYSLGVILYEMATGQVPFEGDTPFTIGVKHKSEIPKDPRALNPDVPADLSIMILKCLEKDPAKRFIAAAEVRSDLEKIEKGIPTTERIVPKARASTAREITVKFRPKQVLIPASAALLFLVAALVVWKVVLKKPFPLLPEQKRSIAVISFENQTGDKAYDYLSKVIPNLLITNLEQSGYFNVTTWERIRDLLKQVGKGDSEFINSDLGFEICQKDAVEVIVLGLVSKSGNTFVTDAKVMDVGTKKLLGTAGSRGNSPDSILNNQVDDMSRQIADNVGLPQGKFAVTAKRIGDLTTHSLEAYNFYLKGQEESEAYRTSRPYFEKAVEADPNFAMALSTLGGESLKKAMELSKNVSEKERWYIEARYVSGIEKNYLKAIPIYRRIVSRYPKEKYAFVVLGDFLSNWTQSSPEESVEMYRRAIALDPTYGLAWNQLGFNYLILKEYDKAIEAFRKYGQIRPGDANAVDSLAETYFLSGQLDEAIENYSQALRIDPEFYGSMNMIAYVYALKGDYNQALTWLDKSIKNSYRTYKLIAYLWKGFHLARLGSPEKGLGYVQMAEDASAALGDKRGKVIADWLRAWIYFDRGDLSLSSAHNESPLAAWNRIDHYFLGGLIDSAESRIESAKSKLAEMMSLISGSSISPERHFFLPRAEWLQALIFLSEKSMANAIESFNRALALNFAPTSGDWGMSSSLLFYNTPFQRDALARAYADRCNFDKAIAEYEKLITFDPKAPSRALVHPLYHYRLGKLYEQRGLKDKAKTQYESFLNLWKDADPGRPEVDDAKKRLGALKVPGIP